MFFRIYIPRLWKFLQDVSSRGNAAIEQELSLTNSASAVSSVAVPIQSTKEESMPDSKPSTNNSGNARILRNAMLVAGTTPCEAFFFVLFSTPDLIFFCHRFFFFSTHSVRLSSLIKATRKINRNNNSSSSYVSNQPDLTESPDNLTSFKITISSNSSSREIGRSSSGTNNNGASVSDNGKPVIYTSSYLQRNQEQKKGAMSKMEMEMGLDEIIEKDRSIKGRGYKKFSKSFGQDSKDEDGESNKKNQYSTKKNEFSTRAEADKEKDGFDSSRQKGNRFLKTNKFNPYGRNQGAEAGEVGRGGRFQQQDQKTPVQLIYVDPSNLGALNLPANALQKIVQAAAAASAKNKATGDSSSDNNNKDGSVPIIAVSVPTPVPVPPVHMFNPVLQAPNKHWFNPNTFKPNASENNGSSNGSGSAPSSGSSIFSNSSGSSSNYYGYKKPGATHMKWVRPTATPSQTAPASALQIAGANPAATNSTTPSAASSTSMANVSMN